MFEHPGSSQAAKLIGMFSIFCVFVSTVILTLDTLPFFQVNIKTVCILFRSQYLCVSIGKIKG